MMLTLTCPQCGLTKSNIPECYLGKRARCKRCGHTFRIDSSTSRKLSAEALTISARTSSAIMPTSTSWQVGDVLLDLYEIIGELGEGGMGKVYKVYHRNWDMDLAVKSPLPRMLQNSKAVENFVREAETWVNLGLHPHTVSCFYVRTIDGIPRVFVECIEGGSLADWIHGTQDDPPKLYEGTPEQILERLLDLAIQFAWGLHFSHEKGLIHQDVKPANVMITEDGIAKVTDFGLANARAVLDEQVAEAPRQSILASYGGMTPAYCSPEQAAIKAQREAGIPKAQWPRLTRRTDMWSWAVSVLEMFLGDVIWNSGVIAGMSFDSYVEMGPEMFKTPMPEGLTDLLRQCFQEDPEQRPATMHDVAGTLQEVYAFTTHQAYSRSEPQAAKLLADSLNNQAVSFYDLGKIAQAETLWKNAIEHDAHHVEAVYNYALFLWRTARIDDMLLLKSWRETMQWKQRDPGRITYLTALLHAERGDYTNVIELLEQVPDDAEHPEIWELLEIAQNRLKSPMLFRRTENAFTPGKFGADNVLLDVSVDGKYLLSGHVCYPNIALRSNHLSVILWEIATGRLVRQIISEQSDKKTFLHLLRLSPDARYMAIYREQFQIIDIQTGEIVKQFDEPGKDTRVNGAACTRDFQWLLINKEEFGGHGTTLWNLETGDKYPASNRPYHSQKVCLSEDACLAVFTDYWIGVHDARSGEKRHWFEPETGYHLKAVHLSADGRYLLSEAKGGTVMLWDLHIGERVHRFDAGDRRRICAVSLSADACYAVSAHTPEPREVKVWDTNTGRCLRTFEGFATSTNALCVSPDNSWLFCNGWSATHPIIAWNLRDILEPFQAPMMLSRHITSEHVLSARQDYQEKLGEAREYVSRGDFVSAANALREARSLPNYAKAPEAMELWTQLYVHLPLKELRGCWEKFHVEDARIGRITPDGQAYVAVSEAGKWNTVLELRDISTGDLIYTFSGHESYRGKGLISAPFFNRDGSVGVSVGSYFMPEYDNYHWDCFVWDMTTGKCLETQRLPGGGECLSPDGRYLIGAQRYQRGMSRTNFGSKIYVWDLQHHQEIAKFESGCNGIPLLRMSPKGDAIISADSTGAIKFWDFASQRGLRTFTGHTGRVNRIDFSQDGQTMLSSSADKTVKVWNLARGRCLHSFQVDAADATWISSTARFSHDSRYIFSLGGEHPTTLSAWEIESGTCLFRWEIPANDFWVTPDSGYLVSSHGVWYLDWELGSQT